ncbi:hypothetical protein ACT7DH_15300 [Bacillus pacificus]
MQLPSSSIDFQSPIADLLKKAL